MGFELIETSVKNGQYHIDLANPDKPNPINDQLQAEIGAVLDDVEADDEAKVLTVASAGEHFAVGADIARMNEWFESGEWDELIGFFRAGQELMSRIADLEVVTIAGINGYALGGGLELGLACDIRIAGESATVGFPEVDLGMIPGWGGTQRLPRVVGESTAKELLVTGRHVDAGEAFELGIVDRVVDDEEVGDELAEYRETLAQKPDHILPYLLDAVETGAESPLETGLSYELVCNTFASFDEETSERIAEFADR
ncbi:MAG: enoyl-CoA hydratase/isomerase family protein [Halobacteriota archaeon]|uniref:enoyl-CoA hydratase/isomerase family protein n=1 Tax=Natronomonas sp. TaxID=2184060 RepID=UPI003976816F